MFSFFCLHRDEDVLSYLKDQQSHSKSHHNITWTPEVIADLIAARREARRRKRIWEEWAIREFGGVGIAYNNPNVTFSKVDDMFKEEWSKLRPKLANLSCLLVISNSPSLMSSRVYPLLGKLLHRKILP